MSEPLVSFRGTVSCWRTTDPAALELRGRTGEHPQEETTVLLGAAAPPGLPALLDDIRVQALDSGGWRVSAGAQQWELAAGPIHVHRDVGASFYRSLPPRTVPAAKRLALSLALALARSRAGLALLRALRR